MDFSLSQIMEEVAFFLSSFATASTAAMYSRYRSTARNLESAPMFTVGPDLSSALRSTSTIPYAILTGRVLPQTTPLTSTSSMSSVISKSSTREFHLTDLFPSSWPLPWSIDILDTHVKPALQYVPFLLTNPNQSPQVSSSVLVDDVNTATFDNLLITSSSTFTPSPTSISSLMASFVRGFHTLGMEQSQAVLPVGTVITAIGQITKLSSSSEAARISRPSTSGPTTPYILTTRNIMDLKSSLRTQATVYKVLSILCGCFTLMTFYQLGRKWWPRFRLRRVQRIIARQRRQDSVQGLSEGQICVTCLVNPREVALFPCGHVCVCADCSLRLEERCPVCRERVVETVPVYLA